MQNVFRKMKNWVADKSDRFVQGGSAQDSLQQYQQLNPPMEGDYPEMEDESVNPFSVYGERKPYRSQSQLAAEAAQAEALRQQQYQQEQMQQTGMYQNPQQQYQQPQMQQTGMYQNQQYNAQSSNVLTFPGMQSGPDGSVYAHVEYIIQLSDRNQCRKVIDYIRSNASVFLNMEMINEAAERQRCVDMLSGAAYALNCVMNRISPRGMYLISSASVRVIPDEATRRLSTSPEVRGFARQNYDHEAYQAGVYQAQAQQPQQDDYDEPQEAVSAGFSSGSPTQRFQSQGAQGMPVSFGTAMAGSHTTMYNAINSHRYGAQ